MVNIGIGGKLSSGKTNFGLILVDELSGNGKEKRIISLVRLEGIRHIFLTNEELIDLVKKGRDDAKDIEKFFFNSVLFLDEIRNLLSARKATTSLNELMTSFLMMLGKLDCDCVFTYQVYTSQVDLQLRDITDFNFQTERVDYDLKPLEFKQAKKRIPDIPVKILVTMMDFHNDKLIPVKPLFAYDPTETGKFYNTRQILLLDRDKYLKN